jgi:hypothetical protein
MQLGSGTATRDLDVRRPTPSPEKAPPFVLTAGSYKETCRKGTRTASWSIG